MTEFDKLEAAACLWEAVLDELRDAPPGPLHRIAEDVGMAELRRQVIELSETCNEAYEIASENGYDYPFDWNFVPWFLDHVVVVGNNALHAIPGWRNLSKALPKLPKELNDG